jgi:hypothetical protein
MTLALCISKLPRNGTGFVAACICDGSNENTILVEIDILLLYPNLFQSFAKSIKNCLINVK